MFQYKIYTLKDVHANCFCASLLRTQFTSACQMPRHALSTCTVEEIWRIALVGTIISMHGFNSLKCSVPHIFF